LAAQVGTPENIAGADFNVGVGGGVGVGVGPGVPVGVGVGVGVVVGAGDDLSIFLPPAIAELNVHRWVVTW